MCRVCARAKTVYLLQLLIDSDMYYLGVDNWSCPKALGIAIAMPRGVGIHSSGLNKTSADPLHGRSTCVGTARARGTSPRGGSFFFFFKLSPPLPAPSAPAPARSRAPAPRRAPPCVSWRERGSGGTASEPCIRHHKGS